MKAFNNCTKLRKLTVPADLIYRSAYLPMYSESSFSGCYNIEELTYTKGTTGVFNGGWDQVNANDVSMRIERIAGENLENVTLENGITELCDNAFDTGRNDQAALVIKQLHLPSSLETIGSCALYGQTNLVVDKPMNNLQSIGGYAFCGCENLTKEMIGGLPGKLETIPEYAFSGCTGIRGTIVFNEGMSIDRYAFAGCTGITEIVIPTGCHISINQVFNECTGLKALTIPADMDYRSAYYPSYSYSMFYGCCNVEEITYTKGATGVLTGGWDQKNASNEDLRIEYIARESLRKVTLQEGITEVRADAFDTGKSDYPTAVLEELHLPSTLEIIGGNAFYGQTNIIVDKPLSNLRSVDRYAFKGCENLTSEMIGGFPGKLESIGDYAFSGCTNIQGKVSFNEGTGIGNCAFADCTGITEICIPAGCSVSTAQVFYNCTGIKKITLPCDMVYHYESWSNSNCAFRGCINVEEIEYIKGETGELTCGYSPYGSYSESNDLESIAGDSLKTVKIGEGITKITKSFSDYPNIERMELWQTEAPEVNGSSFNSQTEIHALYNATGYDEGVWASYHPILDLMKDESDPEVTLAGYTTSLNGNIALNFYMELSEDVVADKNAYMQFALPGTNHTEEIVPLLDARIQELDGKTYYVFSAGVAAKDMTSEIKAQLVRGDGSKSKEWTYTVKTYCDYIRNHPDQYDAESIELVETMLNYGGYAQKYFKYNLEDLANADLEKALPEVALDSSFDPVVSGACTGLTYTGTSSMLTTTTGLRHYFEISGNDSDYTFKVNGKKLAPETDDNGNRYVLIDDIPARHLPTAYTLTVTHTDGSTYTLKYSVYSNVKQVIAGDDFTDTEKNLMKALYVFGEAAKAYFKTV